MTASLRTRTAGFPDVFQFVPELHSLSHGFSDTCLSWKLVKVTVSAEAADIPRGYWF